MSLKLNFGCGTNRLEGWQNYDRELDITKKLPFESNSVDYILLEHVLEHLSGPDGLRFMDEAYRILKSTGCFRICVPELYRLDKLSCRDIILNHGHLMVYNWTILTQMLWAAGFKTVMESKRKEMDGHWKVIGEEKDDLETLRVEAYK